MVEESAPQLVEQEPITDAKVFSGILNCLVDFLILNLANHFHEELPERFDEKPEEKEGVQGGYDHKKHEDHPKPKEELLVEFLSCEMTTEGLLPTVHELLVHPDVALSKWREGLVKGIRKMLAIPRVGVRVIAQTLELVEQHDVVKKENSDADEECCNV